MNNSDSQTIEYQFRKDLLLARKERDALKTEILQTLITAIDNSTAVSDEKRDQVTEVPRRQVSVQDIRAIIEKEIAEVQSTIEVFKKSDQPLPLEFGDRLLLLRAYLDYVNSF